MKIFTRILCILLSFSLLICSIACGDNNTVSKSQKPSSSESHTSQSTESDEDETISSNDVTVSSQNKPTGNTSSAPIVNNSSTVAPNSSQNTSSIDDSIWENGIVPADPETYYTPMSMLTITIGMSKAALKRLITEMSNSGVDALFLGIGGDFIMDDMTVTTEYGTYTLEWFLEGRRFKQSDMDEILAHAKKEGVEIIPTLQTPGHMGPFLSKKPEWRYPGTTSALDLTNPEACAYMHAAYKKYGEYFASKGCKYFSVSADEWGQELNNQMGYDYLYENGEMKYFVNYMNTNIENLSKLGFEVMAWNDAICYNEDITTHGQIDNRLIVLYWMPGWGRRVATPKFLEEHGYRIVNSFHTYYIEANSDLSERANKLHQFNFWIGNYRLKMPVGGMCCIWARPRDNDQGMTTVLSLVPVLDALAQGVSFWKIPTSGNGLY